MSGILSEAAGSIDGVAPWVWCSVLPWGSGLIAADEMPC